MILKIILTLCIGFCVIHMTLANLVGKQESLKNTSELSTHQNEHKLQPSKLNNKKKQISKSKPTNKTKMSNTRKRLEELFAKLTSSTQPSTKKLKSKTTNKKLVRGKNATGVNISHGKLKKTPHLGRNFQIDKSKINKTNDSNSIHEDLFSTENVEIENFIPIRKKQNRIKNSSVPTVSKPETSISEIVNFIPIRKKPNRIKNSSVPTLSQSETPSTIPEDMLHETLVPNYIAIRTKKRKKVTKNALSSTTEATTTSTEEPNVRTDSSSTYGCGNKVFVNILGDDYSDQPDIPNCPDETTTELPTTEEVTEVHTTEEPVTRTEPYEQSTSEEVKSGCVDGKAVFINLQGDGDCSDLTSSTSTTTEEEVTKEPFTETPSTTKLHKDPTTEATLKIKKCGDKIFINLQDDDNLDCSDLISSTSASVTSKRTTISTSTPYPIEIYPDSLEPDFIDKEEPYFFDYLSEYYMHGPVIMRG